METQSVPSDNGGGPPTLGQPGVTKAYCPKCAKTYTWDTYTMARSTCLDCDVELVITAATGETIEQAIQAAAQAMPERVEPVQPTIPGLRPMFNYEAACKSIIEKRASLRRAESSAWLISEKHKSAKKHVETISAELATLIDELEERSSDARYQPKDDDTDVSGDGDAHGGSDGVSAVAPVGDGDVEDASAAPVSDLPVVGDLGAEDPNAQPSAVIVTSPEARA